MLYVPPRKLTWNRKMMVVSRNLLFQGFIFRFHVSFRGCMHFKSCTVFLSHMVQWMGRIMTWKSKGPALPQKMTSTQGAVPLMRAAVPLGEPNRVGKDGWLSKKHQHVAGTKFQHLWEKCSSNLVGTLFFCQEFIADILFPVDGWVGFSG